ncbi:MAG: hypothetical protein IKX82_01140, partial [Bacilli bacterium]|nr:hypothetical protein [Bacilli bacterium]
MQRRNFSKYFLVVSLAATGFLSACSSEGDSSPKGSPVYQVDFYDDAGTQVGYGYAIEGRAVHFRAMDGTAYDYNPHTDMELTTPGARFVFDGWEGTYDTAFNSNVSSDLHGEAVNLDQIKGSCRVTAKFKEKSYKIETIFKNNGTPVEGGANVLFGEAIAIPTAIPTEAHPEYYNNYNFDGWALSKDDTAAKFTSADTLVYKWKSGANANQNAWGLGAPDAADAIDNKGVIYLDKTLTDHMPTYPSYISDGTKWIGLGNLSKGTLPLEFKSTYETEKKDFTVTMMATDGVGVLSSFDVEYGKTIVFEREVLAGNQTKITIKVDGDTKGIYNNVTSNPGDLCYTLKGEYKNETDSTNLHSDMIEGTEM